MRTNSIAPNYKGFRFPPEIISHAVWLYFRFSLSFRSGRRADDAQRGIVVTYETVRQWCGARLDRRTRTNSAAVALDVGTSGIWTRSFSRSVAKGILCGEPSIRTATYWICGSQSRRNTHAAKRFFRKLRVRLQYVPRVIVTDKLKSYGAAKREILQGWEHRQHSRAE
jgi:putative transposase